MKVFVFNEQTDLAISSESVKPIVKTALSLEHRSTDEIAVYFVTTEEISRLHQEFFNDPTPTDCISFPMDEKQTSDYHILGEIFVCPKTAIDYVLKSGEEINEECYRETTYYLIHALLHLLGYDDIQEDDRQSMRQAEEHVMQHLIQSQRLLFP